MVGTGWEARQERVAVRTRPHDDAGPQLSDADLGEPGATQRDDRRGARVMRTRLVRPTRVQQPHLRRQRGRLEQCREPRQPITLPRVCHDSELAHDLFVTVQHRSGVRLRAPAPASMPTASELSRACVCDRGPQADRTLGANRPDHSHQHARHRAISSTSFDCAHRACRVEGPIALADLPCAPRRRTRAESSHSSNRGSCRSPVDVRFDQKVRAVRECMIAASRKCHLTATSSRRARQTVRLVCSYTKVAVLHVLKSLMLTDRRTDETTKDAGTPRTLARRSLRRLGATTAPSAGSRMPRSTATRAYGPSDSLDALYRELAPAVLGYLRGAGAAEPEDLLGDVFVAAIARSAERRRRPGRRSPVGVHGCTPSHDRRTATPGETFTRRQTRRRTRTYDRRFVRRSTQSSQRDARIACSRDLDNQATRGRVTSRTSRIYPLRILRPCSGCSRARSKRPIGALSPRLRTA